MDGPPFDLAAAYHELLRTRGDTSLRLSKIETLIQNGQNYSTETLIFPLVARVDIKNNNELLSFFSHRKIHSGLSVIHTVAEYDRVCELIATGVIPSTCSQYQYYGNEGVKQGDELVHWCIQCFLDDSDDLDINFELAFSEEERLRSEENATVENLSAELASIHCEPTLVSKKAKRENETERVTAVDPSIAGDRKPQDRDPFHLLVRMMAEEATAQQIERQQESTRMQQESSFNRRCEEGNQIWRLFCDDSAIEKDSLAAMATFKTTQCFCDFDDILSLDDLSFGEMIRYFKPNAAKRLRHFRKEFRCRPSATWAAMDTGEET